MMVPTDVDDWNFSCAVNLTFDGNGWNILVNDKAGYTATPVACGWAGAAFEVIKHLGWNSETKDREKHTDGWTDGRT